MEVSKQLNNIVRYFDKTGNKTQDINVTDKIEVHSITQGKSVKISYWIKKLPSTIGKSTSLRNTYQVPSGMQVVVNTPSGEKKYTGGQYVPPEQLQNARVTKRGDSKGSKQGNSPQKEGAGQGGQEDEQQWSEIAEQFKNLNISQDETVNKIIYNLRDYCPCKVESSSKKILPTTKLGSIFTLANISNSVPFIKDILKEYTVYLADKDYKDTFGPQFLREGVLSLENKYIKYYQKAMKPEQSLADASTFIAQRVGHIVIYSIYNDLIDLKSKIPSMEKQKKEITAEIQQAIKKFAEEHRGRMPRDTELPVVQDLSQQLQSIEFSLQKNAILTPLVKDLKDATLHEGGITRYIDNSIEEDILGGVVAQFAKAISIANNFSLGTRKTFDEGLENLAGSHPETLSAIKNLMEALTQINVSG